MAEEQRTLSEIHTDIEFANRYRLEYIKHLITISTGLFLFSVIFLKDVLGINREGAHWIFFLGLGWLLLVISIIAGVFHMRSWAEFYITYIKPFKDKKAIEKRKKINFRRKTLENIQLISFALSLLSFTVFAIRNLIG